MDRINKIRMVWKQKGRKKKLIAKKPLQPTNKANSQTKNDSLISKVIPTWIFQIIVNKFSLAIMFFVVLVTIFSGSMKFLTISPPDRSLVNPFPEWDYERPMIVAVIGSDDDILQLEFPKFISLLYIDFAKSRLRVITLNSEMNINISDTDSSASYNVTTAYQYSQIYNYYRNLGFSESDARAQTVRRISQDIGVRIDRYFWLRKSEYRSFASAFSSPIVGGQDFGYIERSLRTSRQIDLEDQIAIAARDYDELDDRIRVQHQILLDFLKQLNQPQFLFSAGFYLLATPNPLSGIDTNLSRTELLRLFNSIRATSEFSYSDEITTNKDYLLINERLYLDKTNFDRRLKPLLQNDKIIAEQARIDLVNGTGEPGLAGRTKRLLENHSFTIVRPDNANQEYRLPTLYVTEPERFRDTIAELVVFFPDLEVRYQEYDDRPTGDMTLVVT